MNIKFLEYIIEIENCGSINKAANNLFLSQPNLSSILKGIEENLGYKIFRRLNKGIALTNEGRLFIKYAKNIVAEMDNIKRIPMSFKYDSQLSISCTYSSTFMESFMELKKTSPSEELEDLFKETGLIQTLQDVIEKKYKFSLFYCFNKRLLYHKQTANKYNLDVLVLNSNIKPRAIVSSNGVYKNRKSITFSELTREKFVTYENFQYEDWLEVLGRSPSQKTLYVFDRGGLIDSVVRGDYISVVMGEISKEQEALGCKTLQIDDFPNDLSVCLAFQKSYDFSPREREFLNILQKNLKYIS